MARDNLSLLIAFLGIGGMCVVIISLLLLRITLTHRLKKYLLKTGDYWDSGTIDFGFINTAIYCLAITLPYVPRSKNYRLIYGDLNVKAFANRFECIVAYSILIGLSAFFFFGIIMYITDVTGLLPW